MTAEFSSMCDSLKVSLDRRLSVNCQKPVLKKVLRRGKHIDLYFNEYLGDYPIRKSDIKWLRDTIKDLFPEKYANYVLGDICTRNINIDKMLTVAPGNDGMQKPDHQSSFAQERSADSHRKSPVTEIGVPSYHKGLSGRNIAIWQSHGRYFAESIGRWTWQRACLFQTVEDLYTQSYVLPFLVPMLENAGAYVMLPRERDLNCEEYIADAESSEDYPHRHHGKYSETGKWQDGGEGFGDTKAVYGNNEAPFTYGRSRKATSNGNTLQSAQWRVRVKEKSDYAVYVSYKTFSESTDKAHYTVHHCGGTSEFRVNQKMGGGTWMYLGTFTFSPEEDAVITLDNRHGKHFLGKGSVISADAVKIGGGYGNIERACRFIEENDTTNVRATSGMPRFTEAARYWLQWAGMPTEVYTPTGNANDYKDDYTCRGYWVDYLTGGSPVNPSKQGKNIPIDLSLGFHTDAGVAQKDSTIGTLAIYTYRSEGKVKFPDGESRMLSRQLCDMVQSQIVDDIRAEYNPQWQRRQIADRSYLESRTPNVPAMLLELLSHQNFADMKYGLDPAFQFTVSRSVYKGILKFLSLRYSCPYIVQPLPIKDFSAVLATTEEDNNGDSQKIHFGSAQSANISDNNIKVNCRTVTLQWRDRRDPLEPTADADGFILYTRLDDGGFDNGKILKGLTKDEDGRFTATVSIETGHIYSFRIAAFNDGGKSFSSETLAVGIPNISGKESYTANYSTEKDGAAPQEGKNTISNVNGKAHSGEASCGGRGSKPYNGKNILIVNNFTAVSGPEAFDDGGRYAGFDYRIDRGTAYLKNIAYIGDMYNMDRNRQWESDENAGFGASSTDYAGKIVAGNSFDYPYMHGKALFDAGYCFSSMSASAFCQSSISAQTTASVTAPTANDPQTARSETDRIHNGMTRPDAIDLICGKQSDPFYPAIVAKLEEYIEGGGRLLISGSRIGSSGPTTTVTADSKSYNYSALQSKLGYKSATDHANRSGEVIDKDGRVISYYVSPNPYAISVESTDGISMRTSARLRGKVFLRHRDSQTGAAVRYDAGRYRSVTFAFPLEAVKDPAQRDKLIIDAMEYLLK